MACRMCHAPAPANPSRFGLYLGPDIGENAAAK